MMSATNAIAGDKQATPATLGAMISSLVPGDTLHLAAGTYSHFSLSGLNGKSDAWIVLRGPDTGPPAIVEADTGACCNTVEISDSSYIAVENLTIDGKHVDGVFGISAADGVVHDVRIEGCNLINHDGGQQQDGISTKVATWNWVLRRNRIKDVGTGVYLGNSNGSDPFIAGLIEQNVIENPIGYCMEIKYQNPRPDIPGMPTGASKTIIRNNVFIKGDGPSPDGDRPNLLVGGFPETGAGADDRYEIYGNFFFHNPREALLQASGRVSIHDNIFVDTPHNAILLQNHDLPLKQAFVYDNTIFQAGAGIHFGSAAPQGDAVMGNLVFSDSPIGGQITDQHDNITGPVGMAASLVTAPSTTLGQMDFYPKKGACQGAAIDMTKVMGDTDVAIDFNGTSRGTYTFRGAYSGDGDNPGWQLSDSNKGSTSMGVGGASSTSSSTSTSTSGTSSGTSSGAGGAGAAGALNDDGSATGCGCRVSDGSRNDLGLLVAGGLAWLVIRRRKNANPASRLDI
jgi:MYXO-CTERM domain-containing protein